MLTIVKKRALRAKKRYTSRALPILPIVFLA